MTETNDDTALLAAILEAAVDAIVVSDDRGIIQRTNPAANAMFQRSDDEIIGQSVNVLMPKAFAALHDGYMQHHIDTGEKRIIGIGRDVEGLRKDGSIFPLHLSVGHTQVGDRRLFIGILHDLTQRELTQAALSRSQRLDAVGQMTGGIAHDFNNLLTVIIGNLELLEMRSASADTRPQIKDALEAAEMGSDLISRLKVFARRSDLKPEKVDLRDLCEDTLSILKRTLGAQVEIKTEYAPVASPVMVDPVQLQSALMNLALNARDAMGNRGELLITVNNVTIDDDYLAQEVDVQTGEYVCLSVSDNGAGMSVEAQENAFHPFFTTKSDQGGTGLGLAMVYGFVKQSGGHISLYSEVGLGTSFGLYFPALTAPDDFDGAAELGGTKHPIPFGTGMTVLVVEDNPKVRRLSIDRLSDLGFKIAEAESGDQAYKMLSEGVKADILFSDLVMPGALSGYDLAQKVRAEFSHIKILLTSGYASDVVTSRMIKGHSYDVLHKPYRLSDLVQRLQALLADTSDG